VCVYSNNLIGVLIHLVVWILGSSVLVVDYGFHFCNIVVLLARFE